MKVFLLFLFVSFMLGTTLQQAPAQNRRWIMTGIVTLLTIVYFFFDSFI